MEKASIDWVVTLSGTATVIGLIFMTIIKIQITSHFKKFGQMWDNQLNDKKDIAQHTKEINLLWNVTNRHEEHLSDHDKAFAKIETAHNRNHPEGQITL